MRAGAKSTRPNWSGGQRMDGRGTHGGRHSEWQNQCRQRTGSGSEMCGWPETASRWVSERPGPGWREGGGIWRHRVVRGREDGLELKADRAGDQGLLRKNLTGGCGPGFHNHTLGYGDWRPKSFPWLRKMGQNQTFGNRKNYQINQFGSNFAWNWSIWPKFCHLLRTRNCSKLRKIHSEQGSISLTINPSEFKFFGQFVLLWFKFSQCQLMSL